MYKITEFFAPFEQSKVQGVQNFLQNAGAKIMFDSELSGSDEFIVQVVRAGSNGANWEVVYTDDLWCVSSVPETNIWLLEAPAKVGGMPAMLFLG
jgi:hypothetical protein